MAKVYFSKTKINTTAISALASCLLLVGCQSPTTKPIPLPATPLPKAVVPIPETVLPKVITPKVVETIIKDPTPPKAVIDGNIAPEVDWITPKQLASYHWKLIKATDSENKIILPLMDKNLKPELNFNKNPTNPEQNLLGFDVGCNGAGGRYSLSDNVLIAPRIVMTQMGCPKPLDKAESQLYDLMQGTSQLSLKQGDIPFLTQITEKNATLIWQGTQTARSRYAQEPDMVFLAIAPDTKFCDDQTTRQCLQIKPVTYVNDKKVVTGEWLLLDGSIEGYNHIDGEAKVLRVERYNVVATPTKPKHYVYVLDQVIESVAVKK